MLTFCKCHALRDTLNHTIDATGSRMMRSLGIDVKRILLAMRITAAILFICSLHVTAKSVSQTITLSGKDIPLKTVFAEIEKQSGYLITYNEEMITSAKPVTLNAKDEPLLQFLDNTLHKQGLDYIIENKTIVLKRSAEQVIQKDPPIDVKGRVVDENGEPVVGASVKVKGSNIGTQTDANGAFELSGIGDNAVLEISSVGYEDYTISVNKKTSILASLKIGAQSLNEVVVNKGYYTEKRKFSVGNVGKVTQAEIEKQPVTNPLLTLQGRVPGLFITQSTGLPNSGVIVRVQGHNSIQGGNDPFYVIDGVPYTTHLLPSGLPTLGSSGNTPFPTGAGNPLSFINPKDIESIEVLKDADATAIYGSRAANGAILITTKKGKTGPTRVELNIQNGWGKVARELELMNTEQYLQMRREGIQNDGLTVSPTDYDINGFWDTTRYTDWQKTLIGGTARYLNVAGHASGGSANTRFLIGGTYNKETTVFPGNFSDQKVGVHFNVNNISPNQKLKIQFSGSYMVDNSRLFQGDFILTAMLLAPNAPSLYNPDGTLNWAPNSSGLSTFSNPLARRFEKDNLKTTNLISSGVLSYEIIKDLEFKTSLGYTNLKSNQILPHSLNSVKPEQRASNSRYALFYNNDINSWIVEPQLSYKRDLLKSNFQVLIGSTISKTNSQSYSMYGFRYSSDLLVEDINSASQIFQNSTNYAVYNYNAIFGRINYNWSEKVVLNATGRRDGSSRFGSANRFHNFMSLGGAWIFSNSNFIRNNIQWLSFGKLRATYGTTGNDQIGDYKYLSQYFPTQNVQVSYQGIPSVQVTSLPNAHLQWEETKKLQIGADFGMFRERISLTVNYIHNRSSNQLVPYALPSYVGFGSILQNFPATVQNTAWEMSFTSSIIKARNFSWSASGNATIPRNKLVSFPNISTSTYANNLVIGQPITLIKLYHFLGVDPATGVFSFASKTDPLNPSYTEDATVFVNTSPELYGGLGNSFQFKSFSFDVFFQFVRQKGPSYLFGNGGNAIFNNNQPAYLLSRWQQPGDVTSQQRYYSNYSLFTSYNNAINSDANYSDASFIRLKNLSFSWQFPERWMKGAHMQNGKIYLQCQNLFTITNYKGIDPESLNPYSLPPLRIITVGVQVGL